jgi:hypothetical protein
VAQLGRDAHVIEALFVQSCAVCCWRCSMADAMA